MIKKNLFYSAITTLSRLGTNFLLFMFLARLLNVSDIGIITYSMVIGTIISLFIDYGYQLKLIKDISQSKDKLKSLVVESLKMKFLLAILSAFFLFLFFSFDMIEKEYIETIILFYFAYLFSVLSNSFLIPFKIVNKFNVETYYVFLNNLIIFVLATGLVYFYNKSAIVVAIAFFIGRLFLFLGSYYSFNKEFGKIKFYNINFIEILKKNLPYSSHMIIAGLYLNIDTLIIQNYQGEYQVGLYQAGIKLLIAATIGLEVISNVFMPKIAIYLNNKREFYKIIKFNYISILLGLFAYIIFISFGKELILFLYGKSFLELTELLPYIGAIIFLRYVGGIYGILLTLSGNQTKRVLSVFITLCFVVIADLYIVRIYSILGAIKVLLFAHILLNLLYILFTYFEYSTVFLWRKNEKS